MAKDDLKISLILKATDQMSSVVDKATGKVIDDFNNTNKVVEETGNTFDKTGQEAAKTNKIIEETSQKASISIDEAANKINQAGKQIAVFGASLTTISGVNLKFAGDFEAGMNNVSTIIDSSCEDINKLGAEVLKIGKTSPKSIKDLTDGLYDIRSAGIEAADQFRVLQGAEHLAVAGLSTTAEAVDIATSAINAFGLKGEETTKLYDMMFKVVQYGKVTVSEFAQGFGSVAGVVSAADIKLDEYSAAVAAMTTTGLKANIAHTQMKAVIAGLSRATDEQVEVFNRLGAKSFKDLVHKSGGMVNALMKIKTALGGDEAKIISLVGSVEAYNAMMSLTGANNKVFLQTLNDIRYGGDSLSEAYAKQTEGLNSQMAIMRNELQMLGIKFGTALLPVIKAATGAIGKLTDIIDKMPQGLVSFISIATAGVGAIATAGGTALMVVSNIIKAVSTIKTAISAAGLAAGAAGGVALGPIIAVVAGIAALTAGVVFCWKKFEGFRKMCAGVWSVIKAGGAWLAVLWQAFLTGSAYIWNFIKPAVKLGAVILSWVTPLGWVVKWLQKLNDLVQKAGGWRAIGGKIQKWGDEQTAKAAGINDNIKSDRRKAKVDGSHASGLDYVPFDNYIGRLHEGEAVLPKPEANRWRSQKTTNNSISNSAKSSVQLTYSPNVTISGGSKEIKEDFMRMFDTHKDEIAGLLTELFARREARAY